MAMSPVRMVQFCRDRRVSCQDFSKFLHELPAPAPAPGFASPAVAKCIAMCDLRGNHRRMSIRADHRTLLAYLASMYVAIPC
jgi:hypothetical protein